MNIREISNIHTPFHIRERLKNGLSELAKKPQQETAEEIFARRDKEALAVERQLEFAAKKSQARDKYISLMMGENSPLETQRLGEVLEAQGFSYTINKNNDIETIDWETKEQDFAAFTILIQRIRDTVHLSDDEFRDEIFPIVYELVDNSPLYARLNNDGIKRSEAHVENPLQHTISVGAHTITKGLDDWSIFWARLSAVKHDLGKIGKAFADTTHVHAEMTYKLWQEYFLEHPLEELRVDDEVVQSKLVNLFLRPVRYHHLPEVIQFEALTDDEAFTLGMHDPFSLEERTYLEQQKLNNPSLKIPEPPETLFMLGVLSRADAASVDRYIPFAVSNAARYFSKVLSQLQEADLNHFPKEYFREVHEWLYKLFLVVTSEDPAGMLVCIRTLKDPALKLTEFKFHDDQVRDATSNYMAYKKFVEERGFIQRHNGS